MTPAGEANLNGLSRPVSYRMANLKDLGNHRPHRGAEPKSDPAFADEPTTRRFAQRRGFRSRRAFRIPEPPQARLLNGPRMPDKATKQADIDTIPASQG